jgi:hypothetical protein
MTQTCFQPFAGLRLGLAMVALSTVLAGAAAHSWGAMPAADPVTISPQEAWSGVLSGQETTWNYNLTTPEGFQGRLGWSLSSSKRTLARGEIALTAAAGQPNRAAVHFQVPEVKVGVVIQARLSVKVYHGERGGRLAGHDRTLWIFSDDPFALRSDWLKELKITLFDPQGDTQKILQRAKIPFQQVHHAAALQGMTAGVLVVGQGISFEEHRNLPEMLVRLAAGGVPVLCLAPSAGSLPMPGAETAGAGLPVPKHVVLRREDAITALDKRLDADAWPPDGRIVASTMSITAEGHRVVGRVGKEDNGWSWIEVHYPKERTTLLICGFGVVEHWDAGPTPRYLFARMLEYVAPRADSTPR